MEKEVLWSKNQPPQIQVSTPSSVNSKNYPSEGSKKNIFAMIALLFFAVLACVGVYYWQQSELSSKVKSLETSQQAEKDTLMSQLDGVKKELDDAKKEIELLKNPPAPLYCQQGSVYKDVKNHFEVCLPSAGWEKVESTTIPKTTTFSINKSRSNIFKITTSTSFIEDALSKYTKDVYVDTADRKYKVDGVDAIQVSGTFGTKMKRAVTVFTTNDKTFEIVLENNQDATYSSNLQSYKDIVASFRSIN